MIFDVYLQYLHFIHTKEHLEFNLNNMSQAQTRAIDKREM